MKKIRNSVITGLFLFGLFSCSETGNRSESGNAEPEISIEVQKEGDKKDYISLGKEIAQTSFKALSAKLKAQIMDGGVDQAFPFCKENAIPITDSLSKEFDARIERVAIDYRNPENKAIGYDVDVFAKYVEELGNGKMVKPTTHVNESGQIVFYAPIILKGQCVVCHGEPIVDIGESTLAQISSIYPNDYAVGFAEGDLRGLWKITFNN